ncbi:MAG: hypothetical protein II453_00400 [Alphaproteobacteria bacterium]|nr:hypothetical protein [Alphaproteobacteria bacterium]
MNKVKLMIVGTLLAYTPIVNAGEVNEADVDTGGIETTVPDVAPTPAPETNATSVTPQTPGAEATKKRSWWDAILNLFKIKEQKRTAEQAFDNMVENQNVVIDFSNVTDFAQNGDAKMAEYYQKLIATKSFGTKSPNLYVNLSNTGVTLEFVSKWAAQFKKDNKSVVWNLSDNKNLDDNVIDALDFSSVYSLNLSGTSVSDTGIAKISAILETSGIGKLVCIHLSGSKVTDAGVNSLKSSIQKAVELWKTQNPGREYKLQGETGSGVVFEKIPEFPKKRGHKPPKSATTEATTDNAVPAVPAIPAMPETQEAVSPTLPETPASDAGNATPDVIPDTDVSVPDVTVPSPSQSDVDSMTVMNEMAPATTSDSTAEGAANTALSEADAVIESATAATTDASVETPAVE